MARAPVAGRAKTRLEPLLGPEGCARLQAALVRHTAAVAAGIGETSVAVAGPPDLVAPLVPAGVTLFPQADGDLGARITAAVAHVRAGSGPVVVVGTDCPQLGPAHVRGALDRLAAGDDVVFGPARDGGYYLVALAPPAPPAPVFALPPAAWGGPDVLALSRSAADRAGLRVGLLDPEHDLDTPADAAHALADPRVPAAIAAVLRAVAGDRA